jgi:Glycosyl hydrolase 108/Predicted Peptidoglycan domain
MENKKGLLLLLLVGFAASAGATTTGGGGTGGVTYGTEYEEFNSYADYILKKWESQYVKNRIEESKFAIVKEFYPLEDIQNMSLTRAKELIYKDYWQRCKCAKINKKIRLIYLDACINQGQGAAVRMLQKLGGVTVDSVVGGQTIAASNSITAYMYAIERLERYEETARIKADTHAQYLQGWTNRVEWVTNLQISLEGE